jgi:hypothetical protein
VPGLEAEVVQDHEVAVAGDHVIELDGDLVGHDQLPR